MIREHHAHHAMQPQTPKPSPALLERIDRLTGCAGHWILIRDGEPETDCSHQWHQTPEDHLQTCLAERWRDVSLGFVPSYCGFSDYANTGLVGKANYNVLTDPASTPDPHGGILTVGYGWNGQGVVLDLLRAPADAIEAVEALESYPLLSEDEHSSLELAAQDEAWPEVERYFLKDLARELQTYAPEDADPYWAADTLEIFPADGAVAELFRTVADRAGIYWEADGYCGQWIDASKVAAAVTRQELAELVRLPLLAPEQEWRREPYPWPDGSRDPLAPALA